LNYIEIIYSSQFNNRSLSESGIDVIYSNSGSDVIDGGADADRCYPDSESDLLLNCEE